MFGKSPTSFTRRMVANLLALDAVHVVDGDEHALLEFRQNSRTLSRCASTLGWFLRASLSRLTVLPARPARESHEPTIGTHPSGSSTSA